MIYSKTCEYAIRALLFLSHQDREAYYGASEVSKATGVPSAYLSKIFQTLVRCDILKSKRGVGGGVSIGGDHQDLTLMNVIEAIDDLSSLNECAMGLDRCEAHRACLLHEVWSKTKEEMFKIFKQTSLKDFTVTSKKLTFGKMNRTRLKSTVCL